MLIFCGVLNNLKIMRKLEIKSSLPKPFHNFFRKLTIFQSEAFPNVVWKFLRIWKLQQGNLLIKPKFRISRKSPTFRNYYEEILNFLGITASLWNFWKSQNFGILRIILWKSINFSKFFKVWKSKKCFENMTSDRDGVEVHLIQLIHRFYKKNFGIEIKQRTMKKTGWFSN